MKSLINFSLTFFISFQVRATGLPVFDGQELLKQISDSLYFITSVESLMTEVGSSGETSLLMDLSNELKLYQEQVSLMDQLGSSVDDVSRPDIGRSKVLVDQINGITRHLKKLKTLIMLAKSIGARPEAISASMQVLQDERNREKEKFELMYKAFEEKERIRKMRYELSKETRFREALDQEFKIINNISQESVVKAVSFKNKTSAKENLW